MSYQEELAKLAEGEGEYAEFNKRIVNTQKTVLGARLPALRKLAKRFVKEMDAREIGGFIKSVNSDVYEEVLLAGLMVDYAKVTDAERIELLRKYLSMVDSWALIDSVASGKKKFDRKMWWKFVDELLVSEKEFFVRYGVIFMMTNLLDEMPEVFSRLRGVKHDAYYVKMAMAWLYATAAALDYEMTMAEIQNEAIDTWVRRKGLTKMVESYRISEAQKREIRGLRSAIKEKTRQE